MYIDFLLIIIIIICLNKNKDGVQLKLGYQYLAQPDFWYYIQYYMKVRMLHGTYSNPVFYFKNRFLSMVRMLLRCV